MACKLLHVCLAAIACMATLSASSPSRHPSLPAKNGNDSLLDFGALPPHSASRDLQPRADKPFYLRIAPLGASITNGYLSTDGNGYRKYLRDELRFEGWPVNMVGSLNTGSMNDNNNEGHLGWIVSQVTDSALPNIVADQPNLVLINVGTNNAAQNVNVNTIANDYIQLLDNLWLGIPGATVILSTLLVNKNADTNANAKIINTAIRTTVMSHYAGRKIVLADMNDGFITVADLNDDTHPTDYGYKLMASVWWAAFQTVEVNGWLTAPPDIGIADNSTSTGYTCPKVYGHGDGNYQIQRGSGTDDGNYVHASADQGIVWTSPFGVSKANTTYGNNFFFAQLVNAGGNPDRGGEVDEILYATDALDGWTWTFFINNNNNNFGAGATFDPGYFCTPEASRFADLNNNGLDDYLCVDPDGSLWASLNTGGNPPIFNPIGMIGTAPDFWADGYTVDLVHMADIDGDGRADWCVLLHTGDISCQRNGGQGAAPTAAYGSFWQPFDDTGPAWTTVFPSQNRGNAAGVNLVDINGDFKTDWLFMDTTGKVDTFINNRGTGDGGMIPDWQYADVTHGGLASFGVTNANSAVKFGRMYGTGRRDYIWIQETSASPDALSFELRIWKNLGAGGTYLKGDGSNYCDMNGDGQDDYIWVGPNGEIDIYLNDDNRPYWDNHLGVVTLGVARKTIHIADLDGDGKCDFLSVDKASGAVRMWLNNFDTGTRTWTFVDHGIVSGSAGCTEGYGVIENDLGVRFADLTGDGKADYLCIEKSGRVTGYLNRGMTSTGQITFEDVGQIKLATNYDRQNVRFNDVNGDGRADLLWISKYTGDTTVWYNGGEIPTSGSHFQWNIQGALYEGWDRGSNMNFGALGGQHRADIIQVIPRTNIAYISYNKCPSGSGGDDPNMGDPGLPAYTSTTSGCGSGVCPLAAISFPDTTCSADQQAAITQELQYTLEMAVDTAANLQRGVYFSKFFDQDSRNDGDFAANTARVYGNVATMLDGTNTYRVTATCDGTTDYCTKNSWYAHMNDDSKGNVGRVNFCNNFWTDTRIVTTESILSTCQAIPSDLRVVQRTRSAILFHEMTHTSFAMSFGEKTHDYAYGFTFCLQLAAGTFDRSCMTSQMKGKQKILCPDASGNEGVCAGSDSAKNADTYSFVAAGVWFSGKCGTAIPLPDPVSKRAIGSRRSSCPLNSDFIFFDGDNPIGSYVHFGDSYGAGMGTGTTTGDKCRVGSNNFGKLLYAWMNDASIDYVEKVCSGDTLTGLTGQIDGWSDPGSASIGTLSIGGNDVGFSDLVWNCVITPNTARLGSTNRANCVASEQKALNYISDTSTSGLRYKLKEAYLSILSKSGGDYFHLYVTSYVNFFNPITTDCADSTFHYWWAAYKPSADTFLNRIVYLTTDLRSELNTLVDQLNSVIAGAVSDANNDYGSTQVHFVDMTPSFDNGHRWCENPNGEFHEPDSSRDDTWLFLSAWPDVSIDSAADATATVEAAEVAAIISSGQIPLPDAGTCYASLGTDPDPYAYAMCQVSMSISQDPTGPEAVRYQAAEAAISSGNYNSQDIAGYVPTRQIKTFHPRSPGMVAYRDAILAVIKEVGQL